jgi:hypothetical protein
LPVDINLLSNSRGLKLLLFVNVAIEMENSVMVVNSAQNVADLNNELDLWYIRVVSCGIMDMVIGIGINLGLVTQNLMRRDDF